MWEKKDEIIRKLYQKNINNIISGIENVIFLISNNITKQQQPPAEQAQKVNVILFDKTPNQPTKEIYKKNKEFPAVIFIKINFITILSLLHKMKKIKNLISLLWNSFGC